MPFLNLNTFSTLFIVSGMEFQRMLARNARDFMLKDIVLVGGICSVFLICRSYVSSLCTKNSSCPSASQFPHSSWHTKHPCDFIFKHPIVI